LWFFCFCRPAEIKKNKKKKIKKQRTPSGRKKNF